MRPTGVVEPDPVADDPRGVLLRLEAMTMGALLLESPYHPFNQSVLLWAVRRDELLAQPVAFNHPRVRSRRKYQAIIGPQ